MINWAKDLLDLYKSQNSVKLRLKVTYDKNGYTQVSKNGIFIEPMSVEESQIKLWKNDLLERPVKADVEKPNDPLAGNSAPVTESTSTGADDLPF
jgi:hypothetical protein